MLVWHTSNGKWYHKPGGADIQFIEKEKVTSLKYTEKYILIMLHKNKYSNITLPYSAIADKEQLQGLATLFNNYTQK